MAWPRRGAALATPLAILPVGLSLLLCLSTCTWGPAPALGKLPGTAALNQPERRLTQDAAGGADFPNVVSLRREGKHFCGGVLVAPDLVVTGASCVTGRRGSNHPAVRIGFVEASGADAIEEEFATCKTIVHGGYDADRLQDGNDIALLVLNASSGAAPARLPVGRGEPAEGDDLMLAGFRQPLGQRVAEFRVENMKYVENEKCVDLWEELLGVEDLMLGNTENMMCSRSVDGLAACRGDTGNPVITAEGKALVGVISFGPPNCFSVETPTVSTRVAAFLDFLERRGDADATTEDNPDCNA